MYSKCASPICPDRRPGERGVALIAAVFVIVVLALLGTMLVRLAGSGLHTANRELATTRALFAARTAAEWGLYRALRTSTAPPTGAIFASPPLPGLDSCDNVDTGVTDFVQANSQNFGADDVYLYQMDAQGRCYPGSAEETVRQVGIDFWSSEDLS